MPLTLLGCAIWPVRSRASAGMMMGASVKSGAAGLRVGSAVADNRHAGAKRMTDQGINMVIMVVFGLFAVVVVGKVLFRPQQRPPRQNPVKPEESQEE